jgi:hypothetical protein
MIPLCPSVFTSQTFKGALIIPVSFPDVIGTLTPTVTAAFVDAVSTLWRVKNPTLTHKLFSINNKYKHGFLPSGIITQNNASLHKHSEESIERQNQNYFITACFYLMSR